MDADCDLCEVRTDVLYITQMKIRGMEQVEVFLSCLLLSKCKGVAKYTASQPIYLRSILVLYHLRVFFPSDLLTSDFWNNIFYVFISAQISARQSSVSSLLNLLSNQTKNPRQAND